MAVAVVVVVGGDGGDENDVFDDDVVDGGHRWHCYDYCCCCWVMMPVMSGMRFDGMKAGLVVFVMTCCWHYWQIGPGKAGVVVAVVVVVDMDCYSCYWHYRSWFGVVAVVVDSREVGSSCTVVVEFVAAVAVVAVVVVGGDSFRFVSSLV